MSDRFPITPEGYNTLKEEILSLQKNDRPSIIRAISEARDHGDLSENAEYHAAKEKQAFLEKKIADLESKLSRAEIIDLSNVSPDKIQFGAFVEMTDLDSLRSVKYRIVGDYESNITENKISIHSPIAVALLNKGVGDEIEVNVPSGVRYYKIEKIQY